MPALAGAEAGEEAVAVAGVIKAFALSVLLIQVASAKALTPPQVAALQDYMTAASGGGKGGHPLREAQQKLDAIEKRLLPLIFVFKRIGPLVDSRSQELESLKAAVDGGQLDFNPYEETSWLKGKGAETVLFCCYIRNDQRIAQAVQENVARGLPPLAPQMMDRLTARIQAVSRSGGPLEVESDDDDSSLSLPKSSGTFKPSGKSGKPSTAAQKMLDNIGYSEKPATPPPAAAPPPAPAPAAPAAALAPGTPPTPAGTAPAASPQPAPTP